MAGDILVDPLGLIGIILTIMAGFIAAFSLVWRVSKNYNEQRIEIRGLRDEHIEIKAKQISLEKDLQSMADKLRIERREEITKAVLNQHDKFEIIQKQIDSIKADVKSVGSRVDVVDTKVKGHDGELVKVNDRIDKNLGFFTDWNQRIEDNLKNLRTDMMNLIEGAKKEMMGMMNMLVNLGGHGRGRSLTGS